MFLGNGGGSGGDCFCIGGSFYSFRSDIVTCMLCGEYGCHGGGGGDGDGVMVVIVVVEGKIKSTATTINTTTTTDTSNTTTKHSNKI